MKIEINDKTLGKTGKRNYRKPGLRKHGRISRITASGSGAMLEMGGMMMGGDPTRFS
ncbi:MAG: hypothetical protein ISP91_01865 [Pseudomonadales bacterium]|jgi:hypothetical protein|nr:hypothetical protein [Pseudomonadales bacterium]